VIAIAAALGAILEFTAARNERRVNANTLRWYFIISFKFFDRVQILTKYG
jgi:hypothetical protein